MKKLVIAILIVPCLAFSQPYKQKFKYRAIPETGEWICIAGIGIMAISETVLNTHFGTNASRIGSSVGGAMIFAGVVVDMNGKSKRSKPKKKLRIRLR